MEGYKFFFTLENFLIGLTYYGVESQNLVRINEIFQDVINPYKRLDTKLSVQYRRQSKGIEQLQPYLMRSLAENFTTNCVVDFNPSKIEELPEDETENFMFFLQCPPGPFVVSLFRYVFCNIILKILI